MRKPLFLNQIARWQQYCIIFTAAALLCAETAINPADRLSSLKARIDSLEVMKQTAKRQGQSIDDLERITIRLRDSVTLLRDEVQAQKGEMPRSSPKGSAVPKKNLPAALSMIDKILITSGALTVLAFLVFLLFLISALARRKKNIRMPLRPESNATHEQVTSRGTGAAAAKAYTAQTMSQTTVPADTKPAPPPAPAMPAQKKRIMENAPQNLNDMVLKAAEDGQDSKAISQRFHIGVDQVALILKMAKKK